jgi:hypothetical protein
VIAVTVAVDPCCITAAPDDADEVKQEADGRSSCDDEGVSKNWQQDLALGDAGILIGEQYPESYSSGVGVGGGVSCECTEKSELPEEEVIDADLDSWHSGSV